MKKIFQSFLLAILLFGFSPAFGQSVDWSPLVFNDRGIIEMSEVVEVEGQSKDELYSKIRIWFGENYKDSKEVIQVDDKEAGIIMGKAITTFYAKILGKISGYQVHYTIKVDIKENKYRLILTDYIMINIQFGDFPMEDQFSDKNIKKNGEVRDFPLAMKEEILAHFLSTRISIREKVEKADW